MINKILIFVIFQTFSVKTDVELSEENIKNFDLYFENCLFENDESSFEQIFDSIKKYNMPLDYLHSSIGRTALCIAAEKGFNNVIRKLVTLGASPKFKDTQGKTAFDYAVEYKQTDCYNALNDYVNAMELRKLTLSAYQFTQAKAIHRYEIDHALLQHIIEYLHTQNKTNESILVFLPGYNDIMTQKDMIENRFKTNNYKVFVLHSGFCESSEEYSVFDRMPEGIRKIVLSTNIAELSLTINDVVSSVICCKENSFSKKFMINLCQKK